MTPLRLQLALALILLLVPVVRADEIRGHSTTIMVTDQAKHTAPTDSDFTFLQYEFSFTGTAPDPSSSNSADAVDRAWLLLNVDHQYHNGQTFIVDAVEDNSISYKVMFNGLVIEYDTTLHVEDSGFDLKKLFGSLIPGQGDAGFGKRGFVTVHYLVYNTTGALVADQTDTEPIFTITPGSIPDTNIWITYENRSLTVTPVFLAHGILPRFFQDAPTETAGQVKVQNVPYESLVIQITASKTIEDAKLAYGFGKLGNVPGYTLGSLLHDAARTVASLLGGAVNAIVDFVFKFVPHGDKLLYLKDFISTLTSAAWEILLQDPHLLLVDFGILAVGYGLLLFIDPLFKHIFTPIFALAKGLWKLLVLVWIVFLWIVRFLVAKIPSGGG